MNVTATQLGATSTEAFLNRYSDVMLAGLVVAVIAMMILPIPPFLVDTMIAANITISIALLMLSLYIPSSLSLSTFPTLLLFTTLFRLALNITTTRQILLKANAGKIIYTFGDLVVGGDYVVGIIVFLIITIVQFVVIAKGSDRVAEVSARFTLDAMPGKQMSIDADMRAGVIDLETARRRRVKLEDESKMYGAMDGAMKFVKNDAIAGLIIAVVNITGGIAIGIMKKGMTMGAAAQKYTILTIGDGLISQIPALFISVTAGIIVTRVESRKDKGHLAGEIGEQVAGQPKAMLLVGAILFAMALIPGFPKAQFVIIGGVIGVVSGILLAARNAPVSEKKIDDDGYFKIAKQGVIEEEDEDNIAFSAIVPLLLDVSVKDKGNISAQYLNKRFATIGKAFYYEFGVPFPGILFRYNEQVEPGTYSILVNEIPMYTGWIPAGKVFIKTDANRLEKLNIPYTTGADFLCDYPTLWGEASNNAIHDQHAIDCLDNMEVICEHLTFVLRKNMHELFGLAEAKYLLDQMEIHHEDLVTEALKAVPLQSVTRIFQDLIREEISIRNVKAILESIVEHGQDEEDVAMLVEHARQCLKQYICYKFSTVNNVLKINLLQSDLEDVLRSSIQRTLKGPSVMNPAPEIRAGFIDFLRNNVHKIHSVCVIVTAVDIRRYVREMIIKADIDIPVLSFDEVTEAITVTPINRIGLDQITEQTAEATP